MIELYCEYLSVRYIWLYVHYGAFDCMIADENVVDHFLKFTFFLIFVPVPCHFGPRWSNTWNSRLLEFLMFLAVL